MADGRAEGAGGTAASAESETLFLEDTVQVNKDGIPVIGVVARTWHDLDDQDLLQDVEDAIPGSRVSELDFQQFKLTGVPPRHYLLFAPSLPEHRTMLVHESECTLLDRALAFGDVVKRSLTSPQSGTVTAVHTTVGIRHSFVGIDETADPNTAEVLYVPEAEMRTVNEWNEGDFVIYKNCWIGIVDEVAEDVAVRLQNNSVVVVDQPMDLEIPILSTEDDATGSSRADRGQTAGQEVKYPSPVLSRRPAASTPRPKTVAPPTHLSPGQTVTTKKANLRRGRWLFGAYDASIPPTGVVVDVRPVQLGLHWLCQNMMVDGRFVPVPRPPNWIDVEEEGVHLKRFKKSTGGFTDINGQPFTKPDQLFGGGELQVGDRVCFADLDAAEVKYQGMVKRIPRSEAQGFDLNTFIVVETKTMVRVMWQDMTETAEEAIKMVPYLNVDDHEVWPGEIVVVRPDEPAAGATPGRNGPYPNDRADAIWSAIGAMAPPTAPDLAGPTPEFMRPKKMGVVQSVNSADRVAQVRWFKNFRVEVAGGLLIPGAKTGSLAEEVEDVSFYEAVAHQALGCRRGDFVLITPERADRPSDGPHSPTGAGGLSSSTEESASSGSGTPSSLMPTIDSGQIAQLVESLRGMVDGGLLSNLTNAMGHSNHPQLQAVSRLLNQFPELIGQQPPPSPPVPRSMAMTPDSADAYKDKPPNWIGEVVDLGLDGLTTVRLGALDNPVDIRVPIERLHIIFNEDMDFADSEGETAEYDDELLTDDPDGSDESEPEAIEERIIYEGGRRIDNGGEEDWLTDEEYTDDEEALDDGIDEDMPDLESVNSNDADSDTEMSPAPDHAEDTATLQNDQDRKPLVPPPIPDDVPAPEAFSLSSSSAPRTPPRFLVLDSEVPADHAFASQPPTAMSKPIARRINKEHRILSSSLPEGILVRTWESRLDLLRVLIIGPLNTPYELAPFVFDFYFGSTFPTQPPLAHFHSWTNGVGRVNPNLYEDGKICLSLLGTWHVEEQGEGWSANGSSVLQLLVSLMGLVLVREPWYNEAGFNVYQGAAEAALNSALYSEKAYILARGFVKRVLQRPVSGFEKEIKWLYLPPPTPTADAHNTPPASSSSPEEAEKEETWSPGPELLKQVIEKARQVVDRSEGARQATGTGAAEAGENEKVVVGSEGVGRVSAGALVLLKRDLKVMEEILEREVKARGEDR